MRMSTFFRRVSLFVSIALFAAAAGTRSAQAQAPDYAQIQNVLHAKGVIEADGVLHFDLVRSDLAITVGSRAVDSAEAGNGYVNFKYLGNKTWFTNGSLPAQESEAAAVQAALRPEQNIHITAVVNHLALASPRLLWVHFEAQGHAVTLADEINAALLKMASPQRNVTSVPISVSPIPGALFQDDFIGANGTIALLNNKIYVFTIPRDDISRYTLGTVPASASLGVAMTFYVQPLPTGNNIVLTTDISVKTAELQLVRDALVASTLNVGALHDNFSDENLRLFNLNGYAVGDAGQLGDSLYASLTSILDNVD